MSSIQDSVRIRANVHQAYEALTKPDGYRSWWSKNCAISEQVGRECMLIFDKAGTPVAMRYRIDEMKPDALVRWTCIAHDLTPWVGTTLRWEIAPADGAVRVSLDHGGWSGEPPPPVVEGWKYFLGSLKSYLETGQGQPW